MHRHSPTTPTTPTHKVGIWITWEDLTLTHCMLKKAHYRHLDSLLMSKEIQNHLALNEQIYLCLDSSKPFTENPRTVTCKSCLQAMYHGGDDLLKLISRKGWHRMHGTYDIDAHIINSI